MGARGKHMVFVFGKTQVEAVEEEAEAEQKQQHGSLTVSLRVLSCLVHSGARCGKSLAMQFAVYCVNDA